MLSIFSFRKNRNQTLDPEPESGEELFSEECHAVAIAPTGFVNIYLAHACTHTQRIAQTATHACKHLHMKAHVFKHAQHTFSDHVYVNPSVRWV